jgi:hypothetical protein
LVPLLLRWGLILLALRFIEMKALDAFGGRPKLWSFGWRDEHRMTAMAMLHGTLKLRHALTDIGADEQVFNGAGYTGWGFGVPLLQMPFQAVAAHSRVLGFPFFPDRAIYFFYFALFVPVLWMGVDRVLAARERFGSLRLRRHALSWAATIVVVVNAFYPLMVSRFHIYEETIAYFMIVEMAAIAAYVFATRSWGAAPMACLGLAASLGLLVRATGLAFFGMWCVLLAMECRRRKAWLAFGAAAAPLLIFWLWSNHVKTGSLMGIGLNNALPWDDWHTPMQRFGSLCTDTPAHALQAAKRLAKALFVSVPQDATPWMRECHFDFEERAGALGGPFLGTAVAALLTWTFLHMLVRRERRLTFYVPHAMIALLYGAYVWAGAGFAWRYTGDFWPLIVLAALQYVRWLPRPASDALGLRLALVLGITAYATYVHDIEPNEHSQAVLDAAQVASLSDDFQKSLRDVDPPLQSRIECGGLPRWPWHNGQGWDQGCAVGTFTNVFVGVPQKAQDQYDLRLTTEGMTTAAPVLRVYCNGHIYTATRDGDAYVAHVEVRQNELSSRIVMATIEWVRGFDRPSGKLLSIELT